MMMEIMMNPMSVPNSTANLDLSEIWYDVSSMYRAVAAELIACQKLIYCLNYTGFTW